MADRKALKRAAQFKALNETGKYGGVQMTLFPNGEEGDIWVSDGPLGFKIRVRKGSMGLSVEIQKHAGTMNLTVNGEDVAQVTVTQYNYDDKSQAFKRWYQLDSVAPLDETADMKAAYAKGKADEATNNEPTDEYLHTTEAEHNAYLRGFWAARAGL